MDIINKHKDELICHDQDVLNIAFHDKKKVLSSRYNCQNGFLYKDLTRGCFDYVIEEVVAERKDPVIIHYSSPDKPWLLECFNPYVKEWRDIYFKSLWKNQRLGGDNPVGIKGHIRNFLVRHSMYFPNTQYVFKRDL